MRRISLALFVLVALVLALGCGGGGGGGTSPAAVSRLVGQWSPSRIVLESGSEIGCPDPEWCPVGEALNLYVDQTFYLRTDAGDYVGTWSASNREVRLVYEDGSVVRIPYRWAGALLVVRGTDEFGNGREVYCVQTPGTIAPPRSVLRRSPSGITRSPFLPSK